MNPFERSSGRVRRVTTRFGDTLQRVALRELGDAARWSQLAGLNDLVAPYLTDDPDAAGARVLLTGSSLLVPAAGASARSQAVADPDQVYGVDVSNRRNGLSVTEDGDLATIAGYKNFAQALSNRLETGLRELLFHPGYGNGARALIGRKGNRANVVLAEAMVRRAIKGDPRVAEVRRLVAELEFDVLRVTGTAVAVDGTPVSVESASGV